MASYSALRDQSGSLWYLTATGLPDGSRPILALSSLVPAGTNITPTAPSWVAMDVPDSPGRWYVTPTSAGELLVAPSPEPTSPGLVLLGGLPLIDGTGRGWEIQITAWGELTPEAAMVLWGGTTMVASNATIHIINSALYRLGERPIASLDEGTTTANLCRELYPDVRDTLLSWQAWPFATVRQSLARLVATPPSDYQFYYALPTLPVVLRVIDIDLDQRQDEYQREVYVNPADPNDQQAVIATNVSGVVMRYVGRASEGLWSPLFSATMAVYLAASMAPSVSGKATLRESLLGELYGGKGEPGLLAKLRDIAGFEDSPRVLPMPDTYLQGRETHSSAPTTYSW